MQLQLNSERARRASVREAEGTKQAADAELYTAQQQAQTQRVFADAQVYAIKAVAEAINNGGEAAINLISRKRTAFAGSSDRTQE